MEQRETLTQTNRKYNKWICINQIEREREEANEVRYKSTDIKTEETKTNIMCLLH